MQKEITLHGTNFRDKTPAPFFFGTVTQVRIQGLPGQKKIWCHFTGFLFSPWSKFNSISQFHEFQDQLGALIVHGKFLSVFFISRYRKTFHDIKKQKSVVWYQVFISFFLFQDTGKPSMISRNRRALYDIKKQKPCMISRNRRALYDTKKQKNLPWYQETEKPSMISRNRKALHDIKKQKSLPWYQETEKPSMISRNRKAFHGIKKQKSFPWYQETEKPSMISRNRKALHDIKKQKSLPWYQETEEPCMISRNRKAFHDIKKQKSLPWCQETEKPQSIHCLNQKRKDCTNTKKETDYFCPSHDHETRPLLTCVLYSGRGSSLKVIKGLWVRTTGRRSFKYMSNHKSGGTNIFFS